jgi:phosphoribosylglycinamide formyltransferase-1
MEHKRIAVMASGRGTNLQSVIDSIKSGFITNADLVAVVSDNRDAFALERARKNRIEALYIDPSGYQNSVEYHRQVAEELKSRDVDLVVLAGYMRILSEGFVQAFKNRIINIHPSLIPSFCGKGFYGARVHRAVLDYGVKVTGATVHFVDEGTDTGPIILQEAVPVMPDDDVEHLAARVLEVEHRLLPQAINLYCNDMLRIDGRRVHIINITGGAV